MTQSSAHQHRACQHISSIHQQHNVINDTSTTNQQHFSNTSTVRLQHISNTATHQHNNTSTHTNTSTYQHIDTVINTCGAEKNDYFKNQNSEKMMVQKELRILWFYSQRQKKKISILPKNTINVFLRLTTEKK